MNLTDTISFPPVEARRGNSLINWRMIFHLLGLLLLFEAVLLAVCASVSGYYGDADALAFLQAGGINVAVGGTLFLLFRKAEHRLTRRDAYCIVTFCWVLFCLSGMLPFLFSGSIHSVADAFFETVSGFTTTGATILDNIEEQPHGILFWRSLTQWVGGIGIVFFTIAVFPFFGGESLQLFSAESTGVQKERILPKIGVTVKWIGFVYILLAGVETLLLRWGGMGWFDAVNHAFTSTGTGGYSTKQASVGYWNSPFIEYVIAVFMLLSGVNFSLYFLCMRGRIRRFLQDDELRFYLRLVFVLTALITISLVVMDHYGLEKAFRKSFFQVVSLVTTCGFASDDYLQWPSFTWMFLLLAMMTGGCTGSTSGGIKNMRLLILTRDIKKEFRRKLHPNAVLPVKADGRVISSGVVSSVTTFILFYLLCILVGWTLLMVFGLDLVDAMSVAISSVGNVGPALGHYGPEFSWSSMPDAAKWLTSFLMLIGRLELFCVLLIIYPAFWKNQ